MTTETSFMEKTLNEQNSLLRKLAVLLRPMLGEIGEVLVKEKLGSKKPGFIGLLFGHGDKQAIAFAEYVDKNLRTEYSKSPDSTNAHVVDITDKYINALLAAGKKCEVLRLNTSKIIKLKNLDDKIKKLFRNCYSDEVDKKNFNVKLLVTPLKKNEKKNIQSMLYFAVRDGDEIQHNTDLILALSKLVEQLVRNALGLAAISDHELRSTVGYLTDLMPQSFDDYVMPQTLAAIYAYVREVVPVTIASEPPSVEWTDERDEEIAEQLKSIHKAKTIYVNRAVGGSLKGASVYSLNITVHAMDDGSTTTSYPAIAKFSTISEAHDEADGLRRMQRYFSRIGKMLPPPLEVYLLKKDGKYPFETGSWLNSPCISVTPDLEGSVLSEKITEHWSSPTRRVERFSYYLKQARCFVDEIQRQPIDYDGYSVTPKDSSIEETPKQRIIEFIRLEESQKQLPRYKLLIKVLKFPKKLHLKLKLLQCRVVNPVLWLTLLLGNHELSGKWKKDTKRTRKKVLAHGDFHTGNLFYSTDGEHLTVLDYDRVAGHHPEEDFARLDASFVSFVFSLPEFNKEDNWGKYVLPTLSLLAGCHPFRVEELEKNIFARDLVETLEVIQPAKLCPFYVASIVKALLIQLKTTYTKWDKEKNKYVLAGHEELKKNQGRNAATWLYLALMLTHLVKKDDRDFCVWGSPFVSALPRLVD